MNEHTVKSFDTELDGLGQKIAEMGGIAEKMMSDAMDALSSLNGELARSVIATDMRLDILQREIEESATHTISRRQPMAVDLRQIIGAIRVAGDLERVGDLAKNIAKRTLRAAGDMRLPRAVVGLRHMSDVAALQLKNVLDAYAQRDVEKAREVWAKDVELDALEDSIFRDLLTSMMEDPRNIGFCTSMLFVSNNLERMGDHATNIAETVFYLVTGSTLPADRPKGKSA